MQLLTWYITAWTESGAYLDIHSFAGNKDRNQTFHTYDETLADQIYERIKRYYPTMQKTYDRLFSIYSAKRT